MKCPYCGIKEGIDEGNFVCKNCGYDLKHPKDIVSRNKRVSAAQKKAVEGVTSPSAKDGLLPWWAFLSKYRSNDEIIGKYFLTNILIIPIVFLIFLLPIFIPLGVDNLTYIMFVVMASLVLLIILIFYYRRKGKF